jgi:hypothetical protein
MAGQALSHDGSSRFSSGKSRDFEDSWPEEPTEVDAAMTMEEMILEEIRRQGAMPPPANDPRKGTPLR